MKPLKHTIPRLAALLGLLILSVATLTGCQATTVPDQGSSPNVVLVLPGIDGAGPRYGGLMNGLRDGGVHDHIEAVAWGGPYLYLANLRLNSFHEAAEQRLASRIQQWHTAHPDGRISLVGHSAGCGVILETLTDMGPSAQVDDVVLLAPAVSPKLDLAPALSHIRGTLSVFYSEHDALLLRYGTSVAGTYDGFWSASAGLHGFTSADALRPELRSHLRQYPHDSAWEALDNGGGHFGYRHRRFAAAVLAPLLANPTH